LTDIVVSKEARKGRMIRTEIDIDVQLDDYILKTQAEILIHLEMERRNWGRMLRDLVEKTMK